MLRKKGPELRVSATALRRFSWPLRRKRQKWRRLPNGAVRPSGKCGAPRTRDASKVCMP